MKSETRNADKKGSGCVASLRIGGVGNVEKLDVGAGAGPGADTERLWGNGLFNRGGGRTGRAFGGPGGGGREAAHPLPFLSAFLVSLFTFSVTHLS